MNKFWKAINTYEKLPRDLRKKYSGLVKRINESSEPEVYKLMERFVFELETDRMEREWKERWKGKIEKTRKEIREIGEYVKQALSSLKDFDFLNSYKFAKSAAGKAGKLSRKTLKGAVALGLIGMIAFAYKSIGSGKSSEQIIHGKGNLNKSNISKEKDTSIIDKIISSIDSSKEKFPEDPDNKIYIIPGIEDFRVVEGGYKEWLGPPEPPNFSNYIYINYSWTVIVPRWKFPRAIRRAEYKPPPKIKNLNEYYEYVIGKKFEGRRACTLWESLSRYCEKGNVSIENLEALSNEREMELSPGRAKVFLPKNNSFWYKDKHITRQEFEKILNLYKREYNVNERGEKILKETDVDEYTLFVCLGLPVRMDLLILEHAKKENVSYVRILETKTYELPSGLAMCVDLNKDGWCDFVGTNETLRKEHEAFEKELRAFFPEGSPAHEYCLSLRRMFTPK